MIKTKVFQNGVILGKNVGRVLYSNNPPHRLRKGKRQNSHKNAQKRFKTRLQSVTHTGAHVRPHQRQTAHDSIDYQPLIRTWHTQWSKGNQCHSAQCACIIRIITLISQVLVQDEGYHIVECSLACVVGGESRPHSALFWHSSGGRIAVLRLFWGFCGKLGSLFVIIIG